MRPEDGVIANPIVSALDFEGLTSNMCKHGFFAMFTWCVLALIVMANS